MDNKQDWLTLRSQIEDTLEMYRVAINLTNKEKHKIQVHVRHDSKDVVGWSITKKTSIAVGTKFDVECISIIVNLPDDEMTISIEEWPCGIDMDFFPGILAIEHRVLDPLMDDGKKTYIFKTRDLSVLENIISLLDMNEQENADFFKIPL